MGLQAKNPYDDGELVGDVESGEPLDDDLDDADPVELREVHHVAIAVADLDEALADYRDAFGVTVDHRETIAEEAVEVALLSVGGTRLQLMAPSEEDSWLVEFLDGQASGLNHVGFAVEDCSEAMAALASRGYELVDDEPKPGPNGTLTAYVHPPDQPGTLLQLVQG